MDDKKKLKIKTDYEKGRYQFTQQTIIRNYSFILGFCAVICLIFYIIFHTLNNHQLIKFVVGCFVSPSVLILAAQQQWKTVEYYYSEIVYEEKHGHPRKKNLFERTLEREKFKI